MREISDKPALIVESGAKVRTLAKFLHNQFRVLACGGHVRDLPARHLGVDIAAGFLPEYRELPQKSRIVAGLRRAVEGAPQVYLATDPDREGEAIAWHLNELLRLDNASRIEFNEITYRAVRRALDNPRAIDQRRVNAQQARRILDRIVGYSLSPLVSQKLARSLSAGRVQSVALRLICDREREIQAFVPQEYWEIDVTVQPDGHEQTFIARLKSFKGEDIHLPSQEEAARVARELEASKYAVANLAQEERARRPFPPFITSTLQQEAFWKFGLGAARTMRLAQQLYEGAKLPDEGSVGLITYMRTDSVRVAHEAQTAARNFIQGTVGAEYVPERPPFYRSRPGAQEAHEAIRPTDVTRTPEKLKGVLPADLLKLYTLIWNRFVASQMANARFLSTRVDIVASPPKLRSGEGGAGDYGLQATRTQTLFDGFTRVWQPQKEDEEQQEPLPPLTVGQALHPVQVSPSQHFTKPPHRYSEATLVKALEEHGIGRPSTYAPILQTIRRREYVRMEKGRFVPTDTGFAAVDFLVQHFPGIVNVEFTAKMEEELDQVAAGELEWQALLTGFFEGFERLLEQVTPQVAGVEEERCAECGSPLTRWKYPTPGSLRCSKYPRCPYQRTLTGGDSPPKGDEAAPMDPERTCPECGSPLTQRTGRYGPFWGCSKFPKCKFILKESKGSAKTAEPAPESAEAAKGDCPKCGAPLTAWESEDGVSWWCSRHPECDFMISPEQQAQPKRGARKKRAELACPQCGSALVQRTGQYGAFWGCSNYPECKFILKEGRGQKKKAAAGKAAHSKGECPECGSPLVQRTSQYGAFWGCTRYPDCTFILREPKRKVREKTSPAESEQTCPECGAPLQQRKSKFGTFWGCSRYPECKFILKAEKPAGEPPPDEARAAGGAESMRPGCPECGSPLAQRRGKYGVFWGCSGYPDCRYILKASAEGKETAVPACPKCGAPLSQRHGKYGPFWGCSAYPTCDFILKA